MENSDLLDILTSSREDATGEMTACGDAIMHDEEGYPCSLVDGELIRLVEAPPSFAIDSEGAADWLLARRSEAEAALAAIELRRAAMNDRFDAMRREHEQGLRFLEYRYGGQLEQFARGQLEGRKSRTLRLDHGSVSFRKTTGTNRILDMGEAVAWIRAIRPEAVKTTVTEKVAVKDVVEARLLVAEETGSEPRTPWLESTGPGEKVVVSTGIEIDGKSNKKGK